MHMGINRVCIDIETEPFSTAFWKATTSAARQPHAPKLRVACVYSERDDKYRFYGPGQADDLVEILIAADEIVSFFGKGFDVLVLRRHHGLRGKLPRRGKHVDLCEILSASAGHRVSLHRAAALNLGEKKHTAGRKMSELDGAALQEACKSDVSQTYRLWLLHAAGTLKTPAGMFSRFRGSGDGDWHGGPGQFMPDLCPHCGAVGTLELTDEDGDDDTTDGQLAEYIAGTQGGALCTWCGYAFAWNV